MQWKAMVDAYGNVNSILSKLNNSLGLPGQFIDDETGLSYNLNRYYNTAVGRYFKADPIGLSGGINFYNYVHSMPTRLIDPLGLAAIQKCDGLEPNDECNFLRSRIIRKHLELTKELGKYDPVSDALGGHKMKYGSGKTKPYGHYTEIKNLQRGIKNDIQRYNELCRGGGGGPPIAPPIPKYIDADANKLIPIVDLSEQAEMDSNEYCANHPYKCSAVTTGAIVLIMLRVRVAPLSMTSIANTARAL